ncbi:MAG: T9SS type A sorting domain-containing protein [Bacteroidota bacterium]
MKTKIFILALLVTLSGLIMAQPAFNLIGDPLLEGSDIEDIVYDANQGLGFVTNGHDVFTTTDGENWQFSENSPIIGRNFVDDLVLLDGRFFMIASGDLFEYNTVDEAWEMQTGIDNAFINCLDVVDGKLFAIATNYSNETYIFTSDDYGVNWTERALLASPSVWFDINDDTGKYLLFANEDSVCYTSDGDNITSIDFTVPGGISNGHNALYSLTAEDSTDYFYYLASDAMYRYDASDESWSAITQNTVSDVIMLSDMAACDSMLYVGVVSLSGLNLSVDLIASYDHGETWTQLTDHGMGTLPFISKIYQYAPEGFMAGTFMYHLYKSSDGEEFLPADNALYCKRYPLAVNDNVVLNGTENTGMVRSADLLSWALSNNGLPSLVDDITWIVDLIEHNGLIYASVVTDPTTNECALFKSTDNGQSWDEVSAHTSTDIFFFGGNDEQYFYVVIETDTGREYIGYNTDVSSSNDLTSSVNDLNPEKVNGVTGIDTYTYLFMETASDSTVIYYSGDHGLDWTETDLDETNLEFCISEIYTNYQGKTATMFDDDGLPVVLLYDNVNDENVLYKLNSAMTTWEELPATGLPNGTKTALALNSDVTGHENIIVCSEGVYTSSDMENWEQYGSGFRNGIAIINAGIMDTELVLGTEGSGIWSIELIPTSTDQPNISDIKVYPNPATESWHLKFPDKRSRVLRLNDINGRLINTYHVEGMQFTIPVNDLNNAVYLLQIESKNHKHQMKLLKQ